jgi:hypothetical protein
MPAFVKTEKDEKLWQRAKKRAEEQGHAEDWAYVTGIYKKMKGKKMSSMDNAMKTLDRLAGFAEEFMRGVKDRKFRNPDTGNEVKFISLPPEEQKKVYQQWSSSRQQQPKQAPQERQPSWHGGVGGHVDVGMAPKGTIINLQDDGKDYEVTRSTGDKARIRNLETGKEKSVDSFWEATLVKFPDDGGGKKAFDLEVSEEVLLPSDVKRVSAQRMRELGRSLMVAGTRAPRQQMISIAATIDGLLEQLDMLGDQDPSLNALRRRVLMSLRGKVLGR